MRGAARPGIHKVGLTPEEDLILGAGMFTNVPAEHASASLTEEAYGVNHKKRRGRGKWRGSHPKGLETK